MLRSFRLSFVRDNASGAGRLAAIHAGLDLVPFLNDLQIKSREIEIGADGKVSLMHVGTMPVLGYVEGCA